MSTYERYEKYKEPNLSTLLTAIKNHDIVAGKHAHLVKIKEDKDGKNKYRSTK